MASTGFGLVEAALESDVIHLEMPAWRENQSPVQGIEVGEFDLAIVQSQHDVRISAT